MNKKNPKKNLTLFTVMILFLGLFSAAFLYAPSPMEVRAQANQENIFLPMVSKQPTTAATPITPSCDNVPFYPADNANREQETLSLINAQRRDHSLPALATASELTQAARRHSQDMADSGVFSHTGSDGSRPGERIEDACYDWTAWGEIIAAGYTTPESVVNAWMNSDGHRAIILSDDYLDFGAGYVRDSGSNYGYYWTVDFGVRWQGRWSSAPQQQPQQLYECTEFLQDEYGSSQLILYSYQPCSELFSGSQE